MIREKIQTKTSFYLISYSNTKTEENREYNGIQQVICQALKITAVNK